MNLQEALHEAVSGSRMTAPHLDGVYIEHSFSRGFLRCWPVDKPEDEPNRSQCAFDPKPEDRAALDWFEIEAPVYAVDHSDSEPEPVKHALAWGAPRFGKTNKIKRDKQAEALALMSAGPVVPSKWGVPIPGAKPVLDIDAPKRDSWGRIIP